MCSAQSRNLCNLEIALCILIIQKLSANLETVQSVLKDLRYLEITQFWMKTQHNTIDCAHCTTYASAHTPTNIYLCIPTAQGLLRDLPSSHTPTHNIYVYPPAQGLLRDLPSSSRPREVKVLDALAPTHETLKCYIVNLPGKTYQTEAPC